MKESIRPPRVFISYRRDDNRGTADLLAVHLGYRYGENNLFFDTSSISAGAEFPKEIERRLRESDVLVALIGPKWVSAIQKLAIEETDYVRTEISTALAGKKLVVPVLMHGVEKPKANEIHYQVRGILERQFFELHSPTPSNYEWKALLDSIDQSFARWDGVRQEVERMEEVPPAAGLALGYFVNFIRETVPRLTDMNAAENSFRYKIDVTDRGSGSVLYAFGNEPGSRDALKLHILIPPSVNCLLPERLNPLLQRLQRASIYATGPQRPLLLDAWPIDGTFQLIDFPRTLGVLNTWLARHFDASPRQADSAEWQKMEADEIRRFESILKWWVDDPGNGAGFRDRVRVLGLGGGEPGLDWLWDFWRT